LANLRRLHRRLRRRQSTVTVTVITISLLHHLLRRRLSSKRGWPTLSLQMNLGAPSFRSLIAEGWGTTLPEFQISSRKRRMPSSQLGTWETTNL
jgi:hypothetical protein